ncbi:hypothetical protein [Methanorbis rubei]
MVIIGVIIVALAILSAGFTFSYADEGFGVRQLSYTPGNTSMIVSVTDDDLARHPALKTALETSGTIVVTENPFVCFRVSEQCINKSEAMLIEKEFSEYYRDSDSGTMKSRYLQWNENYYRVYHFYV